MRDHDLPATPLPRLLSALLDASSDTLVVADGHGRIVAAGRRIAALTGRPADELTGADLTALFGPQAQAIAQELAADGRWQGKVALAAGLATATVERTEGRGWVAAMQQVTEEMHQDPLTGLPDLFLLRDRLDQALFAARRQQQSVAIVTFDLDHFSRVNDGLGHDIGDRALRDLTDRLRAALRRSDTVARVAGDEFVMVLPMRAVDDAAVVVEKLRRTLAAPFVVDGQSLAVTASLGISVFPADGEEPDLLLKRSATALHHAKQVGRNCFQFFSADMNGKARWRIQVENDLRLALEREELLLHYQPKVDLESGRIIGAEALVRWNRPGHGLVPPAEFIPVAEECGLIQALGAWVMREACAQLARWRAAGLPAIHVSVNVSAPQFHARDLPDRVAALLSEFALPAELLELELTESMLIGNPEQATSQLTVLRALGLNLSIDDFGTGYSSLSYLSRFPITTLKIDRSFVRDLLENRTTAEITRAIIGLSRGLKLEVIAEGVETAEHIAFLSANGCNTVQGFYYSRPLPAEAFGQLLAGGRLVPAAAAGPG